MLSRLSLRTLSALLSVATFALVTGCGGGTTTTTTTSTPTPPATTSFLSLSATSLTFGSITVGAKSAAQTITVTNTGSATANLTGYAVSDPTDFNLVTSSCGSTLAPAAACVLSVTFTPAAAGALTSTVTVTDSASNSPQTITLSGTGVSSGTPTALLTATSVTFTGTPMGTTATAQTVTLANNGTAPLTISSVVLGGTNPTAFAQTNTCGSTIAAGSACIFTITFTPAAAATYGATITITDNAPNSPQTITLSGTGVASAPLVTLSATSLTFPATTVNTAGATQSVTITNTGSATLTGLSLSITGTNASSFTVATTCTGTLAVAANCTATVTFKPATVGIFVGTLSIADNATGAPQTVALSGTGQAAPAPIATLSTSAINFSATTIGATSAASTVTLTNTGNAALNISSLTAGGANPGSFSFTTTCGATLAAAANCAISVTFSPAAATTYTATLTLTTNAAASPQSITLTGTGTTSTSTTTRTLYVFPQPDNSATPLYSLINGAGKTIDMTMYALQDLTFTNDLIAACKRGVVVRVILDQNNEKSNDTPDFNLLNAQSGCTAVWANTAFQVTHEKSFIIDGTTVAIMSLNLQSQYYSTTRDYALIENDANDIAAIQATFNMDFAAGTTAAGVVGASDYSYQPQPGTDLVWSPTTATTNLLAIINNATKTLYIENEEFSATNIVTAIVNAATRGVTVIFVGESSSYTANYAKVKAAGGSVYYYTSSNGFYVHGKTVVADLGLSTEAVYMGSINFSTASLTQNRELGIYITGNTAVSNPIAATIAATVISDESQTGVTKY